MKYVLLGCAIGLGLFLVIYLFFSTKNLEPDAHGIIHHPVYGDYPAEVPFEQGMTLMPGQSAIIEIGPARADLERRR